MKRLSEKAASFVSFYLLRAMFEMCPPTTPHATPEFGPDFARLDRLLPIAPATAPTFLMAFLHIAPDSKHSKSQRHTRKHWSKRDFPRSWAAKTRSWSEKTPHFKA